MSLKDGTCVRDPCTASYTVRTTWVDSPLVPGLHVREGQAFHGELDVSQRDGQGILEGAGDEKRPVDLACVRHLLRVGSGEKAGVTSCRCELRRQVLECW